MDNFYDILGINKRSTPSQIKSAFRVKAKKYHPDNSKNQNTRSKFISSYEAYKILSNQELRKKYDLTLLEGSSGVLNQELTRINSEAERYANSYQLFFWQFLILFFIELIMGHNRLTFPAVLITILGVATIIRGALNQELVDLSVGLGTTALGVLLLLIAVRRIYKYAGE